MASPISWDLQGQGGGTVLNAGTTYTGPIRWIQVVTDTVLSALTSPTGSIANVSRLVGPTLAGGLGIGGKFGSISVTSGVVIVYFE